MNRFLLLRNVSLFNTVGSIRIKTARCDLKAERGNESNFTKAKKKLT